MWRCLLIWSLCHLLCVSQENGQGCFLSKSVGSFIGWVFLELPQYPIQINPLFHGPGLFDVKASADILFWEYLYNIPSSIRNPQGGYSPSQKYARRFK